MKIPFVSVAAGMILGIVSLSPARAEAAERARYLMGTVCRIAADHRLPGRTAPAIEAAFDEIARWESILSDYDDGSELSRLNASETSTFRCSPDLLGFLSLSLSLAAETDGAFDITVGPLIDLYALRSRGRWPPAAEIEGALKRTGWRRLLLDPEAATARFQAEGMRLDPGAAGKGFALDAAARVLRGNGVRWAMLDFGGQILDVGGGPGGCGVPVEIAAEGRESPARRLIHLREASASTSANDERGLIVEGRPLGHILDPRSGRPAEGLLSVTVVAPTGALADALSTALFVMGPDEGAAAASRLGVEALFTMKGGRGRRYLSTPGFERLTRDPCAAEPPASAAPAR